MGHTGLLVSESTSADRPKVRRITTDSFGRCSVPIMLGAGEALGAEEALGAGQISVFMCDTRDDPARERQYLDMLLSRRVDGLIVTGRRIEPRPSVGRVAAEHLLAAIRDSTDKPPRRRPSRRRPAHSDRSGTDGR